jgi:asparagine synthase (glutamine-hydrolysing)
MCGIVGVLSSSAGTVDDSILRHMANAIQHRGPDGIDIWQDKSAGIAMGHRRLAIVDLSSAGSQPMVSRTGRFIIVFNGEIYNHLELRAQLDQSNHPGECWRGHSDTESLLAGFERWGIEETVKKSVGMFSFGIWDQQKRQLTLARDRIGEKPLYYGWQGNTFLFGSELKALRANPAFKQDIDRGALCLFVRHGYIPAPYSIYTGISKLQQGSLLTVSLEQHATRLSVYWSGSEVARIGAQNVFKGTESEALDELESLLKDSVRQQMIADVPVGAFLSGGVDSSTVVSLMQAQSNRPVKTFTIGFKEVGYDEAAYARSVAHHLGTDHTELYVTAEQALSVIPKLPYIYDEPFSDPSQIPTQLVSKLAREHVTVSLSGDGGDELFCGYNRYQMAANVWPKVSALPVALRAVLAQGVTRISPEAWNRIARMLVSSNRAASIGDKLHKGAGALTSASSDELHRRLVSHWDDPASLVIRGLEHKSLLGECPPDLQGLDDVQRMMAQDMLTYLPDDILVKLDRAAMSVSLESRVPFLDHRVVEFAWRLPSHLKMRRGQTKWALRQILYKYVPKELIERPKVGFGVPIDVWLRGPLRGWAETLLEPSRLRNEGFLDANLIWQKWQEHLSGRRNWASQLWDMLMFQCWLENEQQ